jgi:hypothetical protein
VLSLFIVGCNSNSSKRKGIDPKPEAKAADKIADSFSVASTTTPEKDVVSNPAGSAPAGSSPVPLVLNSKEPQIPTDFQAVGKYKIAIFKSALGKEFLLSSNLISQTPTPKFRGMQSRVVSFNERDGVVYMSDVTQNYKVGTGNTPQNILLAEFRVLEDKGSTLTIDFNAGMRNVFTVGDWFASDLTADSAAQLKLPLLHVSSSYLDEVRLSEMNLFIRQIAKVTISSGAQLEAKAYEIRYQLKPYQPDVTFKPIVSPGFEKAGYFEANPILLNDGTTRTYVAKWHDDKPIKFAISANTPLKFRHVVREGLLYWNKVLGRNAVEVVQLEDLTMTAPQFDVSMFQWVDWDAAGSAFADAQVDPRSGQVTSAQIFFPSAFIDANVPKRLRLLEGASAKKQNMELQVQGLKHSHLCHRDVVQDLALGLENKNLFGVSEAAMEKAMLDYVYEVVAHEMGHVVGLRHNFAGNLAANYDFKDRPSIIQQYYKNLKAPVGIVTSSSVMEYSRFEESAINADLLRSGAPALSYDVMAINFLYNKTAFPASSRPLFCTDSQIEKFVDCNRGDAGRSVVSAASGAYEYALKSMAARILNIYVSRVKYPDDPGQELTSVDQINLDAEALAKVAGADLAKVISTLKSDAKFIAVRGRYNTLLKTQDDELQAEEIKYLTSEFERLGGLNAVLLKFNPETYAAELVYRFQALLKDSNYSTGTNRAGAPYSFSEQEKHEMIRAVQSLAKQITEKMALQEIHALSGEIFSFADSYGQSRDSQNSTWLASGLNDQLATIQLNKLVHYATGKTETKTASELIFKDGTKKTIELPIYKFSDDVRLSAMSLLSLKSEDNSWAYAEKDQALKTVKEEGAALSPKENIDLVRLDRATLKWILNQQELEKALSK